MLYYYFDSISKDYTGYPLFLLYRAIKCHCENGPMDVISGQAKFTLSDERLLTEDVEFREMVRVYIARYVSVFPLSEPLIII